MRAFICIAHAIAAVSALLFNLPVAHAQDQLTLAVGQRGNWDTAVAALGTRAGIFEKHGLELEILYTQGGGETMQTVISGAVDIGVGASVMAVLGAYSRGAPLRAIAVASTGAGDIYWYVRADSAIESLSDLSGNTIAYSTAGASTHEIVKAFLDQYGVEARPVPTGSPPATLTQVMSGLIDVGWSTPPFALEQRDRGEIRVIGNGNDATRFQGQTVRLLIANARTMRSSPDVFERFMRAYRETLGWMYTNPDAIPFYAEFANITEALARRTRDEFYPRESVDPDRLVGLDEIMPIAVQLGYMNKALDTNELAELIQLPLGN